MTEVQAEMTASPSPPFRQVCKSSACPRASNPIATANMPNKGTIHRNTRSTRVTVEMHATQRIGIGYPRSSPHLTIYIRPYHWMRPKYSLLLLRIAQEDLMGFSVSRDDLSDLLPVN